MGSTTTKSEAMKTYIYMNHRIHDRTDPGPVVNVQRGKRTRSGNVVRITKDGKEIGRIKFSRRGLRAVTSHVVRAWVELDDGVRVVIGDK